MAGINEDRERQVVPLWRTFDVTQLRGELAPLVNAPDGRFSDGMVSELLRDWEEEGGLSVACDFVSVALILGRFKIANVAARYILEQSGATSAAKGVAELYLGSGKVPTELSRTAPISATRSPASGLCASNLVEQLHLGVRKVRLQLSMHPRNPILWMNFARLYTSLGVQDKALRATRVALSMAPTNRFVLRGASRLLLHLGQKGEAHRLLSGAPNVRFDPWLLSAEIATAASGGKSSHFIKTGRRILELQKFSPFHLSELASAIGTLESLAGNVRKGRQMIEFSLEEPAENAIAQAAWLGRNVGGVVVKTLVPTCSYEANAWCAWRDSRWVEALCEAQLWQADQPFSSRPALLGSHIACSAVEEYDLAVAFAEQGLLSNPDDFSLQNNLAFALANRGDVEDAHRVLRKIDVGRLDDSQRVAYNATTGLVAFRSGDADVGRAFYKCAIALGKRIKDKREAIARIYYALEELRIGSSDAEAARKEAIEGAAELLGPPYAALIERLRRFNP